MILSSELIRARRSKGKINPTYLTEKISIARTLITIYMENIGRKRGTLNEILTNCEELGYNFKMVRGLAFILQARAIFHINSVIPPSEARSMVFLEAGKKVILSKKERTQVLKKVAKTIDINMNDLEESLYADLEDEQTLVEFTAPKPESLFKYYNYSLICALLTYARQLQISYMGNDNLIENLSSRMGKTQIKKSKKTSIQVQLKSTKRPSLRSVKMDELLERLLSLPQWSLSAEIIYPTRYKKPGTLDINWEITGKLIEKDPIEKETIIEIYSVKKKPSFGEIINVEELAYKQGTTELTILRKVKAQGIKYIDLGGILITPDKHKQIKDSLEGIENIESANKIFKQYGISNFIPILESMGYIIEWSYPKNKSRVYQLS